MTRSALGSHVRPVALAAVLGWSTTGAVCAATPDDVGPATPAAHAADRPAYASALRRKVVVDEAGEKGFAIEDRMRHYGVPGASVAVVEGCRIVAAHGFGTATPLGAAVHPRTLFQAGSVSKVVAAAGALRLAEQDRLALDEDVARQLRHWSLPRDASPESRVTPRHLLTHGSGLGVAGFKGYAVGAPLPDLVQILDGAPPANTGPVRIEVPPGSAWRYSGGGFVLLQMVMEQADGKPFAALMQERVLQPAGMHDSSYEQPLGSARAAQAATGTLADGTPIPGGWKVYPELAAAGLWSTPTDLSRFAIALVRSMRGEPGLLGQPMANEMMRRQLGSWGLGVEVSPEGEPRKFSHTGAPVGYRTLWLMFPDTCQGATIMTNADEGMTLAYEIARALADQYHWPERMASERSRAIPTTAGIAERFVGTYRLRDFPDERFDVETGPDGRLAWSRQGRGRRDLMAAEPRVLFSPDSGMRLVALDDDPRTGRTRTLELHFPGGVNIAERVEDAATVIER